ncbi:MAG: hypothetical protein J5984_03695 [Clostridia bacterium]|nr:hypothetical protein [Clostridia bacterium]MBP3336793.1 hypothetical protein [Clostridia bacterium]
MLGLLIFVVLPILIIYLVCKKLEETQALKTEKALEQVNKEKQMRYEQMSKGKKTAQEIFDEKLIRVKYEETIEKGRCSYNTLTEFLSVHGASCLLVCDNILPKFILEDGAIYIAIPTYCKDDTVERYEQSYEQNVKKEIAPSSFYFKKIVNCDDFYTGIVNEYEYALVKYIGIIRASTPEESKRHWRLVNGWLYEAVGGRK